MIAIAEATVVSGAAPAAFFARWADMATWPEWNQDTEWVKLDGPFAEGVTGTLKPKGGPKVPFRVEKLTEAEFTDVSKLAGAKLTFRHLIAESSKGTEVRVDVTLDGPLAFFWNLVLGKGIKASLQNDLDNLAKVVLAA
jgi:hypothetical protein